MITEKAFLDTSAKTKSTTNTMVATDQNSDFTNCENKSETLNVVTNGNFSFRSTNSKINNETENNELDFDNVNSVNDSNGDDVTDYGRPKKLQKGLNQGLIANNLINQHQQPPNNSTFGQLENDFNLNRANKQFLKSSNNSLFTENDLSFNQSLNQSLNQQQSTSRRKNNQMENEFEGDNFECSITNINKDNSNNLADSSSPKVPPLRIVISSSTTGRNSKDLNQNSNTNNYVVSSVDSQINNDKKESNNDNFYLTRSSAQSGGSSSSSTNSSTNVTSSGRITRSQRAAALNHLTSDDSQSRYSHSPDEFSNDLSNEATMEQSQQQQTQTIYLNSQKEKESNKENKDLRRRKGRGKGLQSSITQSNSSSATTNSNLNNGSSSTINQQSLETSSAQLDDQSQLDQSSMINLFSSTLIRDYQMPAYNCYNMFQNIRKQVEKRRQTMCDSVNSKLNQKAPQGFKNYLLTTGNYLLENRNEPIRNVNPNLTIEQINVPELLTNLTNTDQLINLYKEQELEREKLKVQHLVEKEKVKLSIEQEILRVYNRAALAMANQSLPFSFTVLMKDEEIYNPIDQEQEHNFDRNNLESAANQKEGNNSNSQTKNEYSRATYSCQSNNTYADLFTLTGKSEDIGSRCRYSGRLLHSWLQDVEDKWVKIKKEILSRQRREAESLQAIQKLNWEWKLKEISKKLKISLEEDKSAGKFNEKQWYDDLQRNGDQLIPCIKVNEEFDFS